MSLSVPIGKICAFFLVRFLVFFDLRRPQVGQTTIRDRTANELRRNCRNGIVASRNLLDWGPQKI